MEGVTGGRGRRGMRRLEADGACGVRMGRLRPGLRGAPGGRHSLSVAAGLVGDSELAQAFCGVDKRGGHLLHGLQTRGIRAAEWERGVSAPG